MTEVIALGASVIAIIQIADRIIELCKFYIRTVQDYSSDLRLILLETSTLKTIFENLKFFLVECKSPVSSTMSKLLDDDGPVEECCRSITALLKLFPSDSIQMMQQNQSKKRKVGKATLWRDKHQDCRKEKLNFITKLAWPMKANRARKLLDEIACFKKTISLALTTESVQDIKDIKTKALEMHDILTDNQRHEVYRWLQHTDPSPLHHRAHRYYDPGTGNWMLRSPDWANWLNAKQRCLWIHGIPGAGKTVLMSHLIERVKQHCCESPSRKLAYVYYYFYFGRDQDEAVPFLRWLLCQLCRQAHFVPGDVYKMYRYGGEPGVLELLKALAIVLDEFDTTYVIVDAIDESNPREELLRLVRHLVTDSRFRKLQLLASSREYIDIERVMEKISVSVSMSNPFVEEDIRLHVRSILQSNPKFGWWPKELLDEVEDAVSTGARGMFRWAVCQMNALQRLKCNREVVRKAIENLPKTLDETYDRIFLSIPQEELLFVHHALQWIYFNNELYDGEGIPYEVLLQGVERSTARLTSDQNERCYNEDTLRELCGCLINITLEETKFGHLTPAVSFAHYTVREYLDSTRISNTVTDHATSCKENLKQNFMEIVLSEAQNVEPMKLWDGDPYSNDTRNTFDAIVGKFNVYCVVSGLLSLRKWPCEISQQKSSFTLAVDLLDSTRPNFHILSDAADNIEASMETFSDRSWLQENQFWRVRWSSFPSNTDVVCLFNMLLLACSSGECLAFAKMFLQEKNSKDLFQTRLNFTHAIYAYDSPKYRDYVFDGSIIEVFAQLVDDKVEVFKLLLENGTGLFDPSKVLLLFTGSHHHDPNHACDAYCPVDRLLELGADPNVKGYRVTPLQIAVAFWDFEGVSRLLKAGADPNGTGDPDGIFWEKGTLMSQFDYLHNASPLRICRKFACFLCDDAKSLRGKHDEDSEKIEKILLKFGAKEFLIPS